MHVSYWKRFVSLLAVSALFAACELEAPNEGNPTEGEKIREIEAGVFRIDATSEDEWVFFDLDAAFEARESGGWELAFQRSLIAANSAANVQVARLDGVDIDEVEAAPESGYWLDAERPTGGDGRGGGGEGLAFHDGDDWYAYDLGTHTLAPKKQRVYVVLSDEGRAFAVQLTGYYDDAGTPAFITLRLEEITPPVDPEEPGRPEDPKEPKEPEPGTYVEEKIDARDGEAWVYFDLDSGELTDVDSGWDIAFKHWSIATNGPAGVGVAILDGKTLAEVTKPPAQEYLVDDLEADAKEYAFQGESPWYEYDHQTHAVTAREQRVYVVMSTEEKFFAIQMVSYEVDEGMGGFTTFRYKEIEQ